jgi:2-oxoglutarate ferredoxin oxidoreductase subunit gamma
MVILSEEKIGSPFHFQLQAAIVMHPQFLDLYRQRMAPGGILLIDSSMVPGRVRGRNFQVFRLPATRIAVELGEGRAANMVLLGAYLAVTRALPLEQVERTLEKMLAGRGGALLSLNQKALREGARLISSLRRR